MGELDRRRQGELPSPHRHGVVRLRDEEDKEDNCRRRIAGFVEC